MSILILAILIVICVAVLAWAIEKLPIEQPFKGVLEALVLILGVILIADKAGLL